jgi:hypothetical protein
MAVIEYLVSRLDGMGMEGGVADQGGGIGRWVKRKRLSR